jgi:hypothetical protein
MPKSERMPKTEIRMVAFHTWPPPLGGKDILDMKMEDMKMRLDAEGWAPVKR